MNEKILTFLEKHYMKMGVLFLFVVILNHFSNEGRFSWSILFLYLLPLVSWLTKKVKVVNFIIETVSYYYMTSLFAVLPLFGKLIKRKPNPTALLLSVTVYVLITMIFSGLGPMFPPKEMLIIKMLLTAIASLIFTFIFPLKIEYNSRNAERTGNDNEDEELQEPNARSGNY